MTRCIQSPFSMQICIKGALSAGSAGLRCAGDAGHRGVGGARLRGAESAENAGEQGVQGTGVQRLKGTDSTQGYRQYKGCREQRCIGCRAQGFKDSRECRGT